MQCNLLREHSILQLFVLASNIACTSYTAKRRRIGQSSVIRGRYLTGLPLVTCGMKSPGTPSSRALAQQIMSFKEGLLASTLENRQDREARWHQRPIALSVHVVSVIVARYACTIDLPRCRADQPLLHPRSSVIAILTDVPRANASNTNARSCMEIRQTSLSRLLLVRSLKEASNDGVHRLHAINAIGSRLGAREIHHVPDVALRVTAALTSHLEPQRKDTLLRRQLTDQSADWTLQVILPRRRIS